MLINKTTVEKNLKYASELVINLKDYYSLVESIIKDRIKNSDDLTINKIDNIIEDIFSEF